MTTALADTQRWMQAAMTALDGAPPPAGEHLNGSPGLPAEERLELYRRTYVRRVTGCLRELYPALRHALGDELFDDFAVDYLTAHPPRGHSLATLGAELAGHLEATRPAGERWPDFLVDLARLEHAFHEVYDGPGVEGLRLPSSSAVPAGPDEDLAVRVEPAPCLRLLRARYPVDSYLLAVRRGDRPALPPPQARHIAISRRDWVVTLTAIDPRGHALLERLSLGGELGRLGAADWRRVRDWADQGMFSAIHVRSTKGAVP